MKCIKTIWYQGHLWRPGDELPENLVKLGEFGDKNPQGWSPEHFKANKPIPASKVVKPRAKAEEKGE
jgi:hypothetical protein